MRRHFHTIVIGGGCLGVASAVSLTRRKGRDCRGSVCLLEKAVLGAGLSSRHSAIIRSANSSTTAARLATKSTQIWKDLSRVWGVSIAWERVGAIWIGDRSSLPHSPNPWRQLESKMQNIGVDFHAIDQTEARRLTADKLRIDPDELFFSEPDVLQLESADVLQAMQSAITTNEVVLYEHTQVEKFILDGQGRISGVQTNHGDFHCDFLVNAAGGWSADLFASVGLSVPVALEPVYAANWLISSSDLPESLPIIADYSNFIYFRRWHGSILHMHRPRQREQQKIAGSFGRSLMNPSGADIIYDAFNYAVSQQHLAEYSAKLRDRFPGIGRAIFSGGYVSYFDITPDLKFILGPDNQISNLFHCLGAGQALKYAPIFGELIAEGILNGVNKDDSLAEFSISRFSGKPLEELWRGGELAPNTNQL